jgi:hypothetical protein
VELVGWEILVAGSDNVCMVVGRFARAPWFSVSLKQGSPGHCAYIDQDFARSGVNLRKVRQSFVLFCSAIAK